MLADLWYLISLAVIAAIAVFLYLWWPRPPPLMATPPELAIIPYLQICTTDSDCGPDGVCQGFCKKKMGAICSTIYECTNEANVCSGTCQQVAAIGGLNNSCPCDEGLKCVEIAGGTKICRKPSGYPCNFGNECTTSLCNFTGIGSLSLCMDGGQLGVSCSFDAQCESNQCSSGFCQLPGKNTGEIGAYCEPGLFPAVAACDTSNSLCIDDRCEPANQGLLSSCDSRRLCNPEYQCYNAVAGITNMCVYPFNPVTKITYFNSCPLGVCSDGFSCVSGQCKAGVGLFTDTIGHCLSASLNGSAHKIWRWRTIDSKWVLHDTISQAISELRAITRRVSSVMVDELCYHRTVTNDVAYKDLSSNVTIILPTTLSTGNCLGCPSLSNTIAVVGGTQTTTYSFTFTGVFGVSTTYSTIVTVDTNIIAVGCYETVKTVIFTPTVGAATTTTTRYYAVSYYHNNILRLHNAADSLPGSARDGANVVIGGTGSLVATGWLRGIDCTYDNAYYITVAIACYNGVVERFFLKNDIVGGAAFVGRNFNVAPANKCRLQFYRLGNVAVDKYVAYVTTNNSIHATYNQYIDEIPSGLTAGAYLPFSPQAPAGPQQIISFQTKSVFSDGGATPQDVFVDKSGYLVNAAGSVSTYMFDGTQYYVPGHADINSRIAIGDNYMYLYSPAACN